jgi:carbamoyl-phosphate synthase large subunit
MPIGKRVLVPGAGGPGAVNLTRSLAMAPEPIFTVGCDASPFYIHLALTDVKAVVPRCSNEDDYIAAIASLCRDHDLDFIYPNSSLEMAVLTRRQSDLPARMFLPSLATQEIAASKWRTWQHLVAAGIPAPCTILIDDESDVERAFDEIPTRPIWFRGAGIPGKGIGGAALPCSSPLEARGWISFYKGYGGFIASEYLPGENLTWLGIFRDGELLTSQGRQRDLYVIPHVSPSGITGAPAVCHTVSRTDLNELGPRVVLALDPDYSGVAFVDFKADGTGRILPTEVNAGRFGTTNHFYTAAGANFPYFMMRVAFGEDPPDWPRFDVLAPDLYWIRTLDAGPVLLHKKDLGI